MDDNGHARNDTFMDSEAALETMRRYELFLQLQAEADDLTDEEYMARLDEISGGDWFDLIQGSEAYGDSEETAAMAAARREAEEMLPGEQLDGASAVMGQDETLPHRQDDMPYPDGTYGNPEGEPQIDTASMDGTDFDDAVPESELDRDQQETLPETGPDGTALGSERDGNMPGSVPESESAVPEFDTENDAGVQNPDETIEQDGTQDTDGHTGTDGTDAHDAFQNGAMASGANVETAEAQEEWPEPEPTQEPVAAMPSNEDSVMPAAPVFDDEQDGRFVEHSEFHAHDVLDEIAAGSGLAGAVVSYEYVPPETAKPEQPQPEQAPGKMPALSAVYREIERMDGPGRDEPSMDGPAGP